MEEQEIQGKINVENVKLNNEKNPEKRQKIEKKIKILKLQKDSANISKKLNDLRG